MIIAYNDPRAEGESIWPEEFSREHYEGIRRQNPQRFGAMYQQNPTPDSGTIFNRDHFKYYRFEDDKIYINDKRYLLSNFRIYQTIDPAGTESKKSDYFVCLTFGIHKQTSDIIFIDLYREKRLTTKHLAILESQYNKWNPVAQYVEKKTFGINIIQAYMDTGRPVLPLKADVDKISRSEILQTFYENGKVYHRRNCDWTLILEDEMISFPAGKHDDIVDACSYAGIIAQDKSKLTILDLYEVNQ